MAFNLLIANRVSEVVLRFTVCATNPGLLGDHKKCRSRSNPLIRLSIYLSLCNSISSLYSLCILCLSVSVSLSLCLSVSLSFSLSLYLFSIITSFDIVCSPYPTQSVFHSSSVCQLKSNCTLLN